MYRTSLASTFLTDCWATITGKVKQYIQIICNHGTQSRRGGGGGGRVSRVLDFALSPQCRGNTRDRSHIGKHGSHF